VYLIAGFVAGASARYSWPERKAYLAT